MKLNIKILIFIIFAFAITYASREIYLQASADNFIEVQFRIATALDGSLPVGIARWRPPVKVSISGEGFKAAPVEEIKRQLSEIEHATNIPVYFDNNEGVFNIHYSNKFSANAKDLERFSSILHKKNVVELMNSIKERGKSCFVQVKVLNGEIIGAVLFVDVEAGSDVESCVRANIMAAFGFPLYPRLDKNLNSVMTGKIGRDTVLTATDIRFLSALYSADPGAAIRSVQPKSEVR
jgi:hypothetical protein